MKADLFTQGQLPKALHWKTCCNVRVEEHFKKGRSNPAQFWWLSNDPLSTSAMKSKILMRALADLLCTGTKTREVTISNMRSENSALVKRRTVLRISHHHLDGSSDLDSSSSQVSKMVPDHLGVTWKTVVAALLIMGNVAWGIWHFLHEGKIDPSCCNRQDISCLQQNNCVVWDDEFDLFQNPISGEKISLQGRWEDGKRNWAGSSCLLDDSWFKFRVYMETTSL